MSARFVFGSTAAYLAVSVATSAVSIVLVPVMTRALSPADYGVMLLIANGSTVISFVFAFSIAQALPTLFNTMMADNRRRALSTTVFLTIAAVSLVPHVLVAVLSSRISVIFTSTVEFAPAIVWSVVWSYLNVCSLILVLIARMTERHTIYLMVQLPALALLMALVFWLLVIYPMGLVGYYIAAVITAVCVVAAYLLTLRRWVTGTFDPQLFAAAARIGLQTLPWQFAVILTTSSAAFFLTRQGRLEEAGLFSLASGAATLLMAISNSFESVWSPFVLLRKDQPDLAQIQVRIFSLFSSGLLVAASVISIFAHEIFLLLAGPAFQDGYRLVPPLCLAFCLLAFANCFAQGIQARQRTVHYAWIGIVVIATFLVASFFLVAQFGALGIIASMCLSFLTMLVLLQTTSGRFMPVPYPWIRHAFMWLIAVAIVANIYQLDVHLSGIAIKATAFLCVGGLPFLFGLVHLSDIALARKQVRSMF